MAQFPLINKIDIKYLVQEREREERDSRQVPQEIINKTSIAM